MKLPDGALRKRFAYFLFEGLSASQALKPRAHVAQMVEHILGKDEVSGSIPLVGSMFGIR